MRAAARMPERACRDLARSVATAYRQHMAKLMRLDPLRAWRSRVDVTSVLQGIDDAKLRQHELKRLQYRGRRASQGLSQAAGAPQVRLAHQAAAAADPACASPDDDTLDLVARTAFEAYKVSQPEERGVLLDRYRLTDVAFKVVGVGSVGTFCALGLFTDRDGATLLLQLKEAQQSVLAPYAAPSVYVNQGQRVVTGQRIMQGEHDIFLGWTQEHCSDQYCYVRQLKDSRLAAIGEAIADAALPYYATLCGTALARAHARSGDAARIAGYMGSGGAFDAAIARLRHGLCHPGGKRLAAVRRGDQGRRHRGTQRMIPHFWTMPQRCSELQASLRSAGLQLESQRLAESCRECA